MWKTGGKRRRNTVLWMVFAGLLSSLCLLALTSLRSAEVSAEELSSQQASIPEMPDEAKDQLQSILGSKQYRPRHPQQHWKFDLQGILATTWDHFARWMRKHLDDLHFNVETPSFLQPIVDFLGGIGSLFLVFLATLLDYWWVLPLLLLLYFSFRWYLARRPRLNPKFADLAEHATSPEVPLAWHELQAMLQQGKLDEVIEELRKRFRLWCSNEHFIPFSATDREALSRLPKDGADKEVFRQVVRAFERRVFASRHLEVDEVQKILTSSESFYSRPLSSRAR